ncbi:uncharacterized protein MELLADRAFT_63989 [Melampsora larici-populina 98AG31]|uniref:Tet-like 2OG-Fe(II) oxygenase domain-containing protein n=1 Tax=Melampsora larici-populina (strain 98AG31 / pathotype 3-4-7) TaxID=747676 RepID=F4RPR4_MELLP|nr:uncharacterized protein MELLADRAFT_63989 [Melampsora larici-populina 98AG31]EGG05590.1 hypothetical protein MELLADRAFT_63989 [Melampsora larici-populina 98AG31]
MPEKICILRTKYNRLIPDLCTLVGLEHNKKYTYHYLSQIVPIGKGEDVSKTNEELWKDADMLTQTRYAYLRRECLRIYHPAKVTSTICSFSLSFSYDREQFDCGTVMYDDIPTAKRSFDLPSDEVVEAEIPSLNSRKSTKKRQGYYTLNQGASKSERNIWLDVEHNSLLLLQAKEFWAERFSILSMSAFSANSQIAAEACVPSFNSPAWETSSNTKVWASSVATMRDDLTNKPHDDKDTIPYAVGMFATVNRETGKLHDLIEEPCDCNIEGSIFSLSDYAVGINLDHCNGFIEMLWNIQVKHYTLKSTTKSKSTGKEIIPSKSVLTQLANLGKAFKLKKDKMSRKEWEAYIKGHVKGYDQQVYVKLTSSQNERCLRVYLVL